MKFRTSMIALLALAYIPAVAAPIAVPPELGPGSTYRLIFVTSATRDATSNNIAVYNSFVTNAANAVPELAALGTTWTVLGSTGLVNALDNAGLSIFDTKTPFYNTAGALVATGVAGGAAALYGGFTTAHLNPILDEAGAALAAADPLVWTGTLDAGNTDPFRHLGAGPGVSVVVGDANAKSFYWTDTNQLSPALSAHLYGISGELTVPAAVPEPSTVVLLGGALLLGYLKRGKSVKEIEK